MRDSSKQGREEEDTEKTTQSTLLQDQTRKPFWDRLTDKINNLSKLDRYARCFLFIFIWYFVMTKCPLFSRGLDEPLFWHVSTVLTIVIIMLHRIMLKEELKKSKE